MTFERKPQLNWGDRCWNWSRAISLKPNVEAVVNAVNTEGVMGKGIALQCKKKYPDMFEVYQLACKGWSVQPGKWMSMNFAK
jgi:Macro domain